MGARISGPAAPTSPGPRSALPPRPPSRRQHTHLAGLFPEGRSVIDGAPGLGLPLVHHFMEHGMLDLAPGMVGEMAPAQRDLDRLPGAEIYAHLAQSSPHAPREPNGYLAQGRRE